MNACCTAPPNRQKGIVLILAMLIVVLVTSLVVATSWRFELGMSRNENRWHGLQGRLVLEGGERLVSKLLLVEDINDPTDDGQADHLNEVWNAPQTVPIDGGAITVQLEDAQGRFNINLLALPDTVAPAGGNNSSEPSAPASTGTEQPRCKATPELFDCKFTVAQRRFIRFLQTLPMNDQPIGPEDATAIVQAIIDWLDPDNTVSGFGGAEQSYYSGLEVPVIVSNAPMTTISELSLIKGVTPEIYDKLLPYVIALPADGKDAAVLNVNTIPDVMFRMFNAKDINTPLDPEMGSQLARARNDRANFEYHAQGGYQNVNEFVTDAVSEIQVVVDANMFDSSQLDISTRYFIYSADVVIGDKTRHGKSLLKRENTNVTTLWRTDANF
ncbi:MAG TPA: type II secretion system minor pseudopilin GspK [Marinagarivorans sp.]